MSRYKKKLKPGPFWGELLNIQEGVFENRDEGIASFYIAGYSKKIDGIEMQKNYVILWDYMTKCWGLVMAKSNPEFQPNKPVYNYVHTGNGQTNFLRVFGRSVADSPGRTINDLLPVTFQNEPENQYDPNAIKVYIKTHVELMGPRGEPMEPRGRLTLHVPENMLLGYVPRKLNQVIHRYRSAILSQHVDKVRSVKNLFSARVKIKYSPEMIQRIEDDHMLAKTKTKTIGDKNAFGRLRDVLG